MHPRLGGLRLVAITDPALPALEQVARARALATACAPGGLAVQLRDKVAEGRPLAELARALVAALRPHGQLLLVNDRLDVALAVDADGAHLPEAGVPLLRARALLGPRRVLGASRHSAAGAADAAAAGADLVQLGPIWATPSKERYGAPLGLVALTEARALLGARAALVAVGGLDPARAALARAAGATAVAAIRAAWAPDGATLAG